MTFKTGSTVRVTEDHSRYGGQSGKATEDQIDGFVRVQFVANITADRFEYYWIHESDLQEVK